MRNRNPDLLSFRPICRDDLHRLLDLAKRDRDAFFAEHIEWARLYADRLLGTALCQGAALHYVRPDVGINDFDVYTFYAAHPDRHWYARRIKSVDFGDPKFGQSQITKEGFKGRRVDLMGRELNVLPGVDMALAIHDYLSAGRTVTARELRQKVVVLLEPIDRLGTVVWPRESETPSGLQTH
ncbi:MAG: hypothetical protein L0338_05075 [Acidobacteria bacterium]|nr:hypothetical protein [Acidobacteriota bacterium]